MISGINNNSNAYINKFGDDTFLSNIQKNNKKAQEQNEIIDKSDEASSNDNEMIERIKEEEIARKIAEGKSVSLKDVKYLSKNNGELFKKAKKANALKNNLKNEIQAAGSKEEVTAIKNKASLNALMAVTSGKSSEEENIEFTLQTEAVSKAEGEASLKTIDKLIY